MTEFWFGFAVGACCSAAVVLVAADCIVSELLNDLRRVRRELEDAKEKLRKGPK